MLSQANTRSWTTHTKVIYASKEQRRHLNFKTQPHTFQNGTPATLPEHCRGVDVLERGKGRLPQEGSFQSPQTRADASATVQPPPAARVTRRRSAPRGDHGLPHAFPLPLFLTCLAKNLPSSLRLFSFLAAINRSGVAATSSKRCSMILGPLCRGTPALTASCSEIPSCQGSSARTSTHYSPRDSGRRRSAEIWRTAKHTWGSTPRCASSASDADGGHYRPRPRDGGNAYVTIAPVPGGEWKLK